MNKGYLGNIRRLLDRLEETQEHTIQQVAQACADTVYQGGLIYFFGTGHSHMVCEEPFYRAGGLATVYPILETSLMLHDGASKSSCYERIEGVGDMLVGQAGLGKGDVLFLISNSGRNCAVIDAALEGRRLGAVTVAITSLRHGSSVQSRHSSGKRLYEVCDYVLDNGGETGDASIALEGLEQKIGPTSSVMDITLINLIMINTAERLLAKGMTPPIFTSANVDAGDGLNKGIIEAYRPRVPVL